MNTLDKPPRDAFWTHWNNRDLTKAQIAGRFGVSESTVRKWAIEFGFGPSRPWTTGDHGKNTSGPDPSPEEIKRECAALRARWSEYRRTEASREGRVCFKMFSGRDIVFSSGYL
jgi:hypothetical protein